jgi:DNA-binding GntR family transcriptional regulator
VAINLHISMWAARVDYHQVMTEIARRSLSSQAAELVRQRLLDGAYAPGQRLVEVELAASFKISRAPLREALTGLVQEGVVVHQPNKGFYVPAITLADARALYELREAIETTAARFAADRRTDDDASEIKRLLTDTEKVMRVGGNVAYPMNFDFHTAVVKSAHSSLIEQRALEVNRQLQLLRQRSAHIQDRAAAAYAEHLRIASAIQDGRTGDAERFMREHLTLSQENALKALELRL